MDGSRGIKNKGWGGKGERNLNFSRYTGNATRVIVDGLQNSTTYYFRLAAGNSESLSPYSNTSKYQTAGISLLFLTNF